MPLQPIAPHLRKSPNLRPAGSDFELGTFAGRHGTSVDQARFLVDHCGTDLDCIEDWIRMWKKIATG